jgi:hypothetical protein
MERKPDGFVAGLDLPRDPPARHGGKRRFTLETRIFAALAACAALLALAHIIVVWAPRGTYPQDVVDFVHLDWEGNLPSWFSSAQFMALAAILYATGALRRRIAPEERRMAALWFACAGGAVFLSLDEGAAVHEKIGDFILYNLAGEKHGALGRWIDAFPSYFWLLVYVPLALPLAALILRLLARELGRRIWALALAVAIYLTGAAALDFLEGAFGTAERTGIPLRLPGGAHVTLDTFMIEEFLEMIGVALAIAIFSGHLARLWALAWRAPEQPG